MPDEPQKTGDQQQSNNILGQSDFVQPIDSTQEPAIRSFEPIQEYTTDRPDLNFGAAIVEASPANNQTAGSNLTVSDEHEVGAPTVDDINPNISSIDVQALDENPIVKSDSVSPDESMLSTINSNSIQPESISAPGMPTDQVSQGFGAEKKWFSKFKLPILICSAVLLVASICGFLLWYENPQKVLADSIVSVVKAKTLTYTGKYTYTSDSSDSKFKISVDIAAKTKSKAGSFDANLNMVYGDKTYKISGSALADGSGDFYVKFGNVDEIVKNLETTLSLDSSSAEITNSIDNLVTKINNNWIRISSSDLKSYSEDGSNFQKCLNTTLDKYSKDSGISKEIANVYRKNAFIKIDKNLGLSDYQYGFKVKVDEINLKSFMKQFKYTKLYKDLHNCDNNWVINDTDIDTISNNSSSSDNGATVKLWTGIFSHKLTKLEMSSNDESASTNLIVNMKYNQNLTIDKPAKSISLTQLESYIDKVTNSIANQYQLDALSASNDL